MAKPRRSIKRRLTNRFQQKRIPQFGLLGDYSHTVEVPGRPNYVYVRFAGQDVVSEVFNDRVAPLEDLEVLVGYDPEEPNVYQVLDIRSNLRRYAEEDETISYLPEHHRTHEWMNMPGGGNDVVFVELRQFMPLRVTPTTTGVALSINRGVIYGEDKWIYITGQTVDFSSYLPGTGSKYALLSVGLDDGLPDIQIGTLKDTATLLFEDIPNPIPGTYPLAAVRLYGEQTRIYEAYSNTDIADLRFPGVRYTTGSVGGGIGITGLAIYDDSVYKTTGTSISFEDNLSVAITGSIAYISSIPGTGSVSTFLNLTDTPSSYVGQANKYLQVNSGENALEFTTGTSLFAHNIISNTHSDTTGSSSEGDLIVRRSGLWQPETPIDISSDLANIYAINLTEQISDPSNPSSGHRLIYAKSDGIYEINSSGTVIGPFLDTNDNNQVSTINFIFDGGGSEITTGIKGDIEVDFNCFINSATLLADQTGSFSVDIWKDSYANFPPTDLDSITSASPPTLSGVVKNIDTTLSGWSTGISSGDILRFNVDSASDVTRVTLALKVTRN